MFNSSVSLKLNFGLSWSGALKDVFIQVQWHCKVWFCCNGEIWTFKSGTYKSKWDINRTEYSSCRKTCWPGRVKFLLVTVWCHFKWVIYCWLQALVPRITNKKFKVHLFMSAQGHGWNRRAGVFSSSFELLLPRGEVYHCIIFIPFVCPSIIFWWSCHWISKFTQLWAYYIIRYNFDLSMSLCYLLNFWMKNMIDVENYM